MNVAELQKLQDCTAILRLVDGEVLKAKIAFVDLEYEDIIVDVLETNKPENYKSPKAAYTVPSADVASVERVDA